ncbi:hypothetical protein [Nesterenkonia rhizosphaerae]|uniref:Alternate-type signal peptide domain-containing protein n=1 Tax=Nesterenkonia rhizosphaerae TaxID=1348272 RepID=A0ABP9G134_9MICC
MTTTASTKSTSRKKKAAVIGLASALGIGSLLTLAFWQDSESVGAEFSGGAFDLQIATTQSPDGEWNWRSDNSSRAELSMSSLHTDAVTWAPGDVRTVDFALALSEETTHDSAIRINLDTEGEGDLSYYSYTVLAEEGDIVLDSDLSEDGPITFNDFENLDVDEVREFTLQVKKLHEVEVNGVAVPAPQGLDAEATWTFEATQQIATD